MKARNSSGQTALGSAGRNGDTRLVSKLLELGAPLEPEVEAVTPRPIPVCDWANHGLFAVAPLVSLEGCLEDGVGVNARDRWGQVRRCTAYWTSCIGATASPRPQSRRCSELVQTQTRGMDSVSPLCTAPRKAHATSLPGVRSGCRTSWLPCSQAARMSTVWIPRATPRCTGRPLSKTLP